MYEQYNELEMCCGTCKHKTLRIKDGEKLFTCNNKKSDNYTFETDYKEYCSDYEDKENV